MFRILIITLLSILLAPAIYSQKNSKITAKLETATDTVVCGDIFVILDKKSIKVEGLNINGLSIIEIDNILDLEDIASHGLEGKLTKRYLITSEQKGKYTIPAIEISYFEPDLQKYIKKQSKAISFKMN